MAEIDVKVSVIVLLEGKKAGLQRVWHILIV